MSMIPPPPNQIIRSQFLPRFMVVFNSICAVEFVVGTIVFKLWSSATNNHELPLDHARADLCSSFWLFARPTTVGSVLLLQALRWIFASKAYFRVGSPSYESVLALHLLLVARPARPCAAQLLPPEEHELATRSGVCLAHARIGWRE